MSAEANKSRLYLYLIPVLIAFLLAPPAHPAGAQASKKAYLPVIQVNNVKATYHFNGKCDSIDFDPLPPEGADLTFYWCVPKVLVYYTGEMKFYSSWSVDIYNPGVVCLNKLSDAGNTNMYLSDSFGRHYDHFQVGDDAARDICLSDGQTANGWFLFPLAAPGATRFYFHDNDNGMLLTNIILSP